MKKIVLLGMGLFGAWAAVHYGYKALTGECPCTIRKNLQLKLALLLIKDLEAEGYLDLEVDRPSAHSAPHQRQAIDWKTPADYWAFPPAKRR